MYKHNVTSIKESDDRMFISRNEKTLFDSYATTKRPLSDTYTTTEVDDIMKGIEDIKTTVTSQDIVILNNNYKGRVEVLNIKGKTTQKSDTLEYYAVGEEIAENQYKLSVKSMSAGNILDLTEKEYTEDRISVLYGHTYLSTTERYGDRGVKIISEDASIRSCGYIHIPNYPVTLYFKVKVIGKGCVSLKDWESNWIKGELVSDTTYRMTVPANSGNVKIELDSGRGDLEVIYDDITLSTYEHEDINHWEPYKEDVIDIISPVQLHGGYKINNGSQTAAVYDELCVIDDKLCIKKRTRSVKLADLIDTAHIAYMSTSEEGFLRQNIYLERGSLKDPDRQYNSNGYRNMFSVCDKLPNTNVIHNEFEFAKVEATSHGSVGIYAYIKTKQSTLDEFTALNTRADKFKAYIKKLNATLVYETLGTEIIELCDISKLSLETYGNTIIDVESKVKPTEISVKVDTNLGSTLSSNLSELDLLTEEIDKIGNLTSETGKTIELNSFTTDMRTTSGFVTDLTIEGKTHINVLPDLSFYYPNENPYFSYTDGKIIFDTNGETPTKHMFAHVNNSKIQRIKPSTIYTLVARVSENTVKTFVISDAGRNRDGVESGLYISDTFNTINNQATGIITTLMRTRENLNGRGFAIYLPNGVGGRIVIDSIELYEGDIRNQVFMLNNTRSIISTGDSTPIEISATDSKNLCDNQFTNGYLMDAQGTLVEETTYPHALSSKSFIPCEPNTAYHMKIDAREGINETNATPKLYFYDINKEYLGHGLCQYIPRAYTSHTRFTTPKDASYIKIRLFNGDRTVWIDKNTDVKISITKKMVTNNNTVDEYNSNSSKIDLTKYGIVGGLKSLPDGQRDTIFKKDGKFYLKQVAGYVKLTDEIADNRWMVSSLNSKFETIQCFIYKKTLNPDMLPPYIQKHAVVSNLHTSFLPAVAPGNTQVSTVVPEKAGVAVYDSDVSNELRIGVLKSDLSSLDITGFKKWLKRIGGLEVVYQLNEPIITELDENLDIYLYENSSEITVHGGGAVPKLTFTCNDGINNKLSDMMDRVEKLEQDQLDRIKLILDSTYTANLSLHKTMLMNANARAINEIDEELISIIKEYISSGDFDREKLEQQIDLFTLIDMIDFETSIELFDLISEVCDIKEIEL